MSNPITNHIEKNVAEGNIIKDLKNIFRLKEKTALKIK